MTYGKIWKKTCTAPRDRWQALAVAACFLAAPSVIPSANAGFPGGIPPRITAIPAQNFQDRLRNMGYLNIEKLPDQDDKPGAGASTYTAVRENGQTVIVTIDPETNAVSEAPLSWMPLPEILRRLKEAGFRNIEHAGRAGPVYRIVLQNQQGLDSKLEIDPANGNILSEERQ